MKLLIEREFRPMNLNKTLVVAQRLMFSIEFANAATIACAFCGKEEDQSSFFSPPLSVLAKTLLAEEKSVVVVLPPPLKAAKPVFRSRVVKVGKSTPLPQDDDEDDDDDILFCPEIERNSFGKKPPPPAPKNDDAIIACSLKSSSAFSLLYPLLLPQPQHETPPRTTRGLMFEDTFKTPESIHTEAHKTFRV